MMRMDESVSGEEDDVMMKNKNKNKQQEANSDLQTARDHLKKLLWIYQ
jgi:hypothetical protein